MLDSPAIPDPQSLVRVTRGVRRPPDQVAELRGRLSALLAGCPPDTVISGVAAAQLHGLWLPPIQSETRPEMIIHRRVHRGAHRANCRRPEVRARRQVLLPDEIMIVDGLAVTTPARTWLSLATRLPAADLVAAGDCVLRGATQRGEIAMLLQRAAHRPGIVVAREILPLLDPRSRSRPESHIRYLLHVAGLPAPAVNRAIYAANGEWLAEPDLSYEDVRLAIEYNGGEHADPRQMRRDITRGLDLSERGGWQVVTFGPAEVFGRPDQVAGHIRRLRSELQTRRPLNRG